MRRTWLALVLASLGTGGCGSGAAGPAASVCSTRMQVEVCVDRSEYRQGQSVRVTTRNRGTASVIRDGCSTKIVGKTSRDAAFEEVFNPALRCGEGVSASDILAAAVELAPGEVYVETLDIPFFAFQGFYRVNVWLLDPDGSPASPAPAFSGTFEVFRTAD